MATEMTTPELRFLEKRGAISHRGGQTFSRSAVLHREMQLLRALLVHYDPHRTGAMSEATVQLVACLLPEQWPIAPAAVENLAQRLQERRISRLRSAGVDPPELVVAVAALGFGEKVALLDHALQHQAPAAARALEEEPRARQCSGG